MTFQEVQMEHWTLGEARQSKVTDAATHYKARGLNHSIVLPADRKPFFPLKYVVCQ